MVIVDQYEPHRCIRSCINSQIFSKGRFPFECLRLRLVKLRRDTIVKIKNCIAHIKAYIFEVYFSYISAPHLCTLSPQR